MVKNLPAMQETGFDPWVRQIPWRREWLPTPVFLPGGFHGQRSLVGNSPWDHKESDTTEQLTVTLFFFHMYDGIAKCSTRLCAQLWLTLGNPMDDSLPGFSVHEISIARTLGSCHSLLQGIFQMEGSNANIQSLVYCRQILYPLSY